MQIDLNCELGRLFVYIANVAVAIRMNSLYAKDDIEKREWRDIGSDVMWLSDCLHNFDCIGEAIQSGEPKRIVLACDELLRSYQTYIEAQPTGYWKTDPIETMKRYPHLFQPQQAVAVLTEIRSKAAAFPEGMASQ